MTVVRSRLYLAFACVALTVIGARAQEPRAITGDGTEGFRALLNGKGLQPLDTIEQLRTIDPNNVLIVAFRGGDALGRSRPDLLEDIGFLPYRDFVARGGALWVATDKRVDADWIAPFDAEVTGHPVYAAPNARPYRNNPECPFVTRFDESIPNLFDRAGAAGGEAPADNVSPLRVATNRPTYLRIPSELDTLGGFPTNSWRYGRPGEFNPFRGPFVQSKRYDGGGRFLLMADHSVFINSMLLPQSSPNDNLAFAANCINWMMRNNDGLRTHVLFIEDGHIWSRDDYNLMLQLPSPRPEEIAAMLWANRDLLWQNSDLAETVLAQVEEAGIFNELEKGDPIGELLRDLLEPWILARFLLIAGAIALLGYAAMSLMRSRARLQRSGPRLALLLDRMRPRTGLLDWRLRSGLGKGQYFELARDRARTMFADRGVAPGEGGPLPKVIIDAGWWDRGRIARNLAEVWSVAYGAEPVRVTAKQWEPFQKKVRQLSLLLEVGSVKFV